MKVYLLIEDSGYDGKDYLGIYKNKEDAEKELEGYVSSEFTRYYIVEEDAI